MYLNKRFKMLEVLHSNLDHTRYQTVKSEPSSNKTAKHEQKKGHQIF
jgi:hypothetical protein